MRAALRRRYSRIVGADPGKRPSVLLEHAGAWAYSLRSPSAVEGLLVLFPARANSPHRNFVRAYFFFILIESNTIIPVRKDGSMARSCRSEERRVGKENMTQRVSNYFKKKCHRIE